MKLGDVNYDWNNTVMRPQPNDPQPNNPQPFANNIELYHSDIWVAENSEIRIPIRVRNLKEIVGMQFTLNFNSNALQFKKIEKNILNMRDADVRREEGLLSFVWSEDVNLPKTLNDDAVLMELVFNKRNNFSEEEIKISSVVTEIEAWDKNYIKHDIIKGIGKIHSGSAPANWSVTPNPTSGIVWLTLSIPKKQQVSMVLTSADGRIVWKEERELPAGVSKRLINLQSNKKLSSGIYYLQLPGIDASVKKLVLIQ
jgi:hypothetical protein